MYFRRAIDCICEFYDGSDPIILFSQKEVAFIQGEIKDEAEHRFDWHLIREGEDRV